MEVIRKIIDSELLVSFMELPEQMTNCKVEIIVLPVSKTEKHVSNAHSTELVYEMTGSAKTPVFGCAKGQFVMAADFDAPLDDFKEYME
jgi:hypothetical protein